MDLQLTNPDFSSGIYFLEITFNSGKKYVKNDINDSVFV